MADHSETGQSRSVRLAIADPPYPPFVGAGGVKPRASRWYGDAPLSATDRPADVHVDASEWDDPARHRRLLSDLLNGYDGFAIATTPDGIAAYGPLPPGLRIMAWVKPNGVPGAHRLRSCWEPVLLYPPADRRSNRGGVGMVPDVLTANKPGEFIGAKPHAWTWWVLDALSYREGDEVDDLFPGSGRVAAAMNAPRLFTNREVVA